MGKSSGGGGGGAQTVTTVPWSEAQPHLTRIMDEAYNIYQNQPPAQYPGLSIAQRSFPTMLSEELTLGRALAGSGITDSARNQYQKTVDGGYLDVTQNPQFQSAMGQVADKYRQTIAPQTDTAFSRAGAFGGSAHQNQMAINQRELSRGLNDVAANLYQGERDKQYASMLSAPQFAQQDYREIAPIAQVGAQRDAYNQLLLDDAVNKYGFDANKSRENLSQYLGFISGAANGTSQQTSTQPMYSNKAAGALGGGLLGAQLGSQIAPFVSQAAGIGLPWLAGPWGAGIGAGVGILGGLL